MDRQPTRKKNRLDGYDYTKCGAYFVTICTKEREKLFWADIRSENPQSPVGAIINRPPNPYKLSEIGMQVQTAIDNIPMHYKNVRVDYYCVMPDHVHILLSILPPKEWFENNDGRLIIAPTDKESFADGNKTTPNVSNIVRQFKIAVTKQISRSIWQKSFYDEIIRSKTHYLAARDYIASNPVRWAYDYGDPSDFENWLSSRT